MVEPTFISSKSWSLFHVALRQTCTDGSLNISFQVVGVFSFGLVNLCFLVCMSFNKNVIESWSLKSWIGP